MKVSSDNRSYLQMHCNCIYNVDNKVQMDWKGNDVDVLVEHFINFFRIHVIVLPDSGKLLLKNNKKSCWHNKISISGGFQPEHNCYIPPCELLRKEM